VWLRAIGPKLKLLVRDGTELRDIPTVEVIETTYQLLFERVVWSGVTKGCVAWRSACTRKLDRRGDERSPAGLSPKRDGTGTTVSGRGESAD
jgi:hypothetical protein